MTKQTVPPEDDTTLQRRLRDNAQATRAFAGDSSVNADLMDEAAALIDRLIEAAQ